MDTIFFSNLEVVGTHGLRPKEHKFPQKFLVDLKVNVLSRADYEEKIKNTFDYGIAKKIVEEVFKGKHINLLETLAEKIISKIFEVSRGIYSIEITIKKPDIWDGVGIPGITIRRFAKAEFTDLLDFNAEEIFNLLLKDGGVSIPILNEERRRSLFAEATKYNFLNYPEYIGPVREQFKIVKEFPENSSFWTLKHEFEKLLWLKLRQASDPPIEGVTFNELLLQKYWENSIGITPHKDGRSYHKLTAIFILGGEGRFALCKNRAGQSPKYLETTPGNVILLTAPGFSGSDYQPMHFLDRITRERIIFSLRQKVLKS